MITRAQRVRLGVFVIFSFMVLIALLAAVLGSSIWSELDEYWVRYDDSVSGLEIGAPVKYNGVRVGRVESIAIDKFNISQTTVTIALNPGTPVKANTKAVLDLQGITGLKFIELLGGTSDAKTLSPGAEIQAGIARFDEVTGRLESVSVKAEILVNQLLDLTNDSNRALVSDVLERTGSLANTLDRTVSDNAENISTLIKNLSLASARLAAALEEIRKTAVESREAVVAVRVRAEDALKEAKGAMSDARGQLNGLKTEQLSSKLDHLLGQTSGLVEQVDLVVGRSKEDLRRALKLLAEAASDFRDFARLIREDPSRLLRQQEMRERRLP